MQALTKYPSGGGDVLMGSVTTRDEALHERIKLTHMHLGLGVAGNDAELVLRSLPSLPLRYPRRTPPAASWRPGWRPGRKCDGCCTRHCEGRPATNTGAPPAPRRRACSR